MTPIPYKTDPVVPIPAKKRRASSARPRKRRTQTMADKGNEPTEEYRWQELLDSYVFAPDDSVNASLTERNGKWIMHATFNGKSYAGQRDTLEEAFKATDALIYEHAKKYWLRSVADVVMAPWKGVLP